MSLLAFSILVLGAVATAYCVTTGLNKLRSPSGNFRRISFVVEEPEDNIPEKDEKE